VPDVTPYLLYEDVAAAIDWLEKAFGLRERLRSADPEGTVSHAEMTIGDGEVMLGWPGPDYQCPRTTGHVSQFVHVNVPDVDAHFEQARAAGAEVLSAPEDQPYGDRRYDAVDLEGHRWSFAQRVRDVPPDEWGATVRRD